MATYLCSVEQMQRWLSAMSGSTQCCCRCKCEPHVPEIHRPEETPLFRALPTEPEPVDPKTTDRGSA